MSASSETNLRYVTTVTRNVTNHNYTQKMHFLIAPKGYQNVDNETEMMTSKAHLLMSCKYESLVRYFMRNTVLLRHCIVEFM